MNMCTKLELFHNKNITLRSNHSAIIYNVHILQVEWTSARGGPECTGGCYPMHVQCMIKLSNNALDMCMFAMGSSVALYIDRNRTEPMLTLTMLLLANWLGFCRF